MNIGILSGSFDPIHIGHLILANYITEYTNIEEIWFLVTPQNPLKRKVDMTDENKRYDMLKLAISAYPKMKASNIEFELPRPSYTVNTLRILREKYSQHSFSLIIGGDNWMNFENWKDYQEIIANHKVYVYPRLNSHVVIDNKYEGQIVLLESPIVEVSSSFIREGIHRGKNLRAFLPEDVEKYIKENNLYS